MTPAYLAAAWCVAEPMPSPARAAFTLLLRRRTGTVHDFRTLHPRGVSAKVNTEKLSFRRCRYLFEEVGVISFFTLNP